MGAKESLNRANKYKKKSVKKLSNLKSLLSISFPQGFRKSKKCEHWTSVSGDKVKNSNTKKVRLSETKNAQKQTFLCLKSEQTDRQTDRHTDTQMDKSTYRKHRPRWPML